jgi:D-alanyl-D-alanine carboxypeptidase
MTIRELIFPLLLESSNDAAEAIAEWGGRSAFIDAMNEKAKTLSLRATYFADPSGLSHENVSTVRDLSNLLTFIYESERHLLDIASLPRYIGEHHDWLSNNPAVHEAGYQGGKHGYTPEAERTFLGVFDVTLKNDERRTVGMILLRSENLKTDISELLSYLGTHVGYE